MVKPERPGENLGQYLHRVYTKHQQEEDIRLKAEKEREEKPFVVWAENMIRHLPKILGRCIEDGRYTMKLDLPQELKSQIEAIKANPGDRHHPPAETHIAQLFEKTYAKFCANGGGKLMCEFCEQNDLQCNIRQSDGIIYFEIRWDELKPAKQP